MDDLAILFYLLLVLGFFVLSVVLPIIAIVVALMSKRKFQERLAKLEARHGVAVNDQSEIEHLTARVRRLEELISRGATPTPEQPNVIDSEPAHEKPAIESPAPQQETGPPPPSTPPKATPA